MLSLRDSMTILLINASKHLLEKWLFVQSLLQAVYIYKRDAQEQPCMSYPNDSAIIFFSTVSELPLQERSDLFCLFIQYLVLFWSYWKSDLVWSFAISRKAEMINVFSLARKGKMQLTAHVFHYTGKLYWFERNCWIFLKSCLS